MNLASEPPSGPVTSRHVTLSDVVLQSGGPNTSVLSIPSPSGGTDERWSFTRMAMPSSPESGPGGLRSMSWPSTRTTDRPADGNVRMMTLVSLRVAAGSNSSSQTRLLSVSPPPPRTQLSP